MKTRERKPLLLGVNIDHVATLRQARRGRVPDPVQAVREAIQGGADGITIHLREDRRHIQDHDLPAIQRVSRVPVNLEMALHPDILRIALRQRPQKACIVPERRQELTTEGGLDVERYRSALKRTIPKLKARGIEVSLFIDPSERSIKTSAALGADAVEIHTGSYANATGRQRRRELERIRRGAWLAARLGLKVHAGHGLDYLNVKAMARIPEIEELNIGHSIVARAVFTGLREAVRQMKDIINSSR